MFVDSPMEVCPKCGKYVLLDQTVRECADEHGCKPAECPLQRHFSGHEFAPAAPEEPRTTAAAATTGRSDEHRD